MEIRMDDEEYRYALESHGRMMYNLALDTAYIVLKQIVEDDDGGMKKILNAMKKTDLTAMSETRV